MALKTKAQAVIQNALILYASVVLAFKCVHPWFFNTQIDCSAGTGETIIPALLKQLTEAYEQRVSTTDQEPIT